MKFHISDVDTAEMVIMAFDHMNQVGIAIKIVKDGHEWRYGSRGLTIQETLRALADEIEKAGIEIDYGYRPRAAGQAGQADVQRERSGACPGLSAEGAERGD